MACYAVTVYEHLSRTMVVEANSEEDAYDIVFNDYRHNRICLDFADRDEWWIHVEEEN